MEQKTQAKGPKRFTDIIANRIRLVDSKGNLRITLDGDDNGSAVISIQASPTRTLKIVGNSDGSMVIELCNVPNSAHVSLSMNIDGEGSLWISNADGKLGVILGPDRTRGLRQDQDGEHIGLCYSKRAGTMEHSLRNHASKKCHKEIAAAKECDEKKSPNKRLARNRGVCRLASSGENV